MTYHSSVSNFLIASCKADEGLENGSISPVNTEGGGGGLAVTLLPAERLVNIKGSGVLKVKHIHKSSQGRVLIKQLFTNS